MLCEKPYMIGVVPAPCMQCLPCLINRKRVWAHRILLESKKHGDSCFVTLTYNEKHTPTGGSLSIRDYQLWLKRLRRAISPTRVRYFLAGEYGEKSYRPHYHIALFGISPVVAGGLDGRGGAAAEAWVDRDGESLGYSYVGDLTPESAAYICGYVTKKLSNRGDENLKGKVKEFARMSLRPGLGAGAMDDVARVLENVGIGVDPFKSTGDVPVALRHGRRMLPLGRYLRRLLRANVGFGGKEVPKAAAEGYARELRRMFEEDLRVPENTQKSLQKITIDKDYQKRLNLKARHKLSTGFRKL